jgi:uncharacterized membrane protein YhhN
LALAGLLGAESVGSVRGKWATKPLASLAFIATALAAGALDSPWGRAVLVALVLGAVGDVLLIPKSRKVFLAGILAFLASHIAYAVGFAQLGQRWAATAVAAAILVALALTLGRWLASKAPAELKPAVVAYLVVISIMVAFAAGAFGAGAPGLVLGAAIAFYLSDLAVAMNRFVSPSFKHRAWGLPLYYGAQLVFAWSVGPVGV